MWDSWGIKETITTVVLFFCISIVVWKLLSWLGFYALKFLADIFLK